MTANRSFADEVRVGQRIHVKTFVNLLLATFERVLYDMISASPRDRQLSMRASLTCLCLAGILICVDFV
jgi:hypothetical protein